MCDRMGINVWEVIDAAATKPFGFMPFYPGPGLGGHCIPIDPFYLSWKTKQAGIEALCPNGHAQVFDGKGVYRSMGSGMCGRHEAQVTK